MPRMGLLRDELREGVALLTLDDPARRNAISLELADAIVDRLARLADDPEVTALVITGTPPAFSAGAALAEHEAAVELLASLPVLVRPRPAR